nr:hypothetical protein [Streptomyces monomycini]
MPPVRSTREQGGAPSLSSSRRSSSTRRCSSSAALFPFTTAVNSSKAMLDSEGPECLRSHGIRPSPVNHRHTLSTTANKASRHAKAGKDMSQTVTGGPPSPVPLSHVSR